jgi:hypothetical protein
MASQLIDLSSKFTASSIVRPPAAQREPAPTFAIMGSEYSLVKAYAPHLSTSPGREHEISRLQRPAEAWGTIEETPLVFDAAEDPALLSAVAQSPISQTSHQYIVARPSTYSQTMPAFLRANPACTDGASSHSQHHVNPSSTARRNSTERLSMPGKQDCHSTPATRTVEVTSVDNLENATVVETPKRNLANSSKKQSTRPSTISSRPVSNTPNKRAMRATSPPVYTMLGEEPLSSFARHCLGSPSISYTTPYSHIRTSLGATQSSTVGLPAIKTQEPIANVWAARVRTMLLSGSLSRQYAEMDELTPDPRKKFRKLRIVFDEKMRQSDEWYRREQKSEEQIKRLAQENE